MSCIEQMKEWLKRHPGATIEEAWLAGYWTSCSNWCKREQ